MTSKSQYKVSACLSLLLCGCVLPNASMAQVTGEDTFMGDPITFVYDVAIDGRTLDASGDKKATAVGTPFKIEGKIFRRGTIPKGDGFNLDLHEGIGFVSHIGLLNISQSAMEAGAAPHATTVQTLEFFQRRTGKVRHTITTLGQEGGMERIQRFAVGGKGKFDQLVGEVTLKYLGLNHTGFQNYRLKFILWEWRVDDRTVTAEADVPYGYNGISEGVISMEHNSDGVIEFNGIFDDGLYWGNGHTWGAYHPELGSSISWTDPLFASEWGVLDPYLGFGGDTYIGKVMNSGLIEIEAPGTVAGKIK